MPVLVIGTALWAGCSDGEHAHDPLRIPWHMPAASVGASSGADGPTRPDGAPPSAEEVGSPSFAKAATCLAAGCHEDMGVSGEFHTRVTVGACLECHEPIGNLDDHSFQEVSEEGRVCRTCHPVDVAAGIVHEPYLEGKCLACHDPHGRNLMDLAGHDRVEKTCSTCHEVEPKAVAHGPYRDGDCLECHEPHESAYVALARSPSAELCLSCHDQEMASSRDPRGIADMAGLIGSSEFLHGPIRDGECDGCHVAHGSENADILRKAFPPEFYQSYDESHYALCFGCHDRDLVEQERTTETTNFRHGDRNLHFVHVHREKGRSCRACHALHASNLPFHMRETVPYGIGDWEFPLRYNRTEDGGSCLASCHDAVEYSRSAVPGDAAGPIHAEESEP